MDYDSPLILGMSSSQPDWIFEDLDLTKRERTYTEQFVFGTHTSDNCGSFPLILGIFTSNNSNNKDLRVRVGYDEYPGNFTCLENTCVHEGCCIASVARSNKG